MAALERELIAAVMLWPETLHEAPLTAQQFESESMAKVWRVIQHLSYEGEPYDAVTVSQSLDGQLSAEVIGLANDTVAVASSVPHYAEQIRKRWQQRTAKEMLVAHLDGPIDPDAVIRDLMTLDQESGGYEVSIKEALGQALDDMQEAMEAGGGLRGITTGLIDLDNQLGGWQRGDLAIIGARPSMGKTSLLIQNAAACGVPCGLISAEQPAYQIAQRHIANIGKVALTDIRRGKVDKSISTAIAATHGKLKNYWLYDRSSPSIADVQRIARRWHHKHGIEILFVDYVQRIQGIGERRFEQVADVVRGFKTLARDLDIPVVALAQVKREVDSRNNKRPNMGDLSDSSEIEKEADQVLTLYRDEVYDSGSPDRGIAEIQICKNRHGHTGTVRVTWAGEFVAFGNLMRGAA